MPLALTTLVLSLATPPAPPRDPCGPEGAGRREEARAAYGDGRFLDAARRFQALAACSRDARDLHNALQSLVLAEHFAAALELWSVAEAGDISLSADLRARARTLVDIARSHTTTVRVALQTEGIRPPRSAALHLCRVDAGPASATCADVRRTLLVPRHGAVVDVPVDRGTWQIRVTWDGRPETAERTLTVATAPLSTAFVWRASQPHRRLAAGFVGMAGVTSATGLGLAVVGWQYDVAATAADHNRGDLGLMSLRTGGAALGATGVGMAISGAAMAFATSPELRRFGVAGLSVGVVFAGTGAGLIGHTASAIADLDSATGTCGARHQCIAGEQLAGGLALGLGVGLIAGGVASLIADRPAPRRRYSATPAVSRGFAGVRLRIDF